MTVWSQNASQISLALLVASNFEAAPGELERLVQEARPDGLAGRLSTSSRVPGRVEWTGGARRASLQTLISILVRPVGVCRQHLGKADWLPCSAHPLTPCRGQPTTGYLPHGLHFS